MLLDTPLIRPEAVARLLCVSLQRLANIRLEGGGPPFVKIGRSVFYRTEDLTEWLAANRRKSTSDRGRWPALASEATFTSDKN